MDFAPRPPLPPCTLSDNFLTVVSSLHSIPNPTPVKLHWEIKSEEVTAEFGLIAELLVLRGVER